MSAVVETPVEQPKNVVHLSASAIKVWQLCPKQFQYTRILRLRYPPSYEQALGTFVHLVLEAVCNLEAPARTLGTARTICRSVWDSPDWQSYAGDDPDIDSLKLRVDAWNRVNTAFQVLNLAALNVVATELGIEQAMDDVPMVGSVDLLTREPDGMVITDYKTGCSPFEGYMAERFNQLATYAALIEDLYGERPVRLRLVFLADGVVREIDVDERTVRGARDEAVQVWQEVQGAYEADRWPVNPQKLCSWCPFIDICPFHNQG